MSRLAFADGEDDDRYLGPAAEAADHLEPVHPRQPEIEDHRIGPVALGEDERGFARPGEIDVVASRPEVGCERPQDLRLVVDDQDPRHVRP